MHSSVRKTLLNKIKLISNSEEEVFNLLKDPSFMESFEPHEFYLLEALCSFLNFCIYNHK